MGLFRAEAIVLIGLFNKKRAFVPMTPLVQQSPRSLAWIVTFINFTWEAKSFSRIGSPVGYEYMDPKVERINKLQKFQEAWFDGRVYDNEADCVVAANERNLQEAERLMNRSIGE